MGRECVDGGVEDRGQVKPKHGAQEKQRPSDFIHLTAHNTHKQEPIELQNFCSDVPIFFNKMISKILPFTI